MHKPLAISSVCVFESLHISVCISSYNTHNPMGESGSLGWRKSSTQALFLALKIELAKYRAHTCNPSTQEIEAVRAVVLER